MEDHFDNAMQRARKGKNAVEEQRKFQRKELLYYKESGLEQVEVLTAGAGNSCEECLRLHGKRITIGEALEKMPLPVKTCTCDVFGTGKGYCRCVYTPVV